MRASVQVVSQALQDSVIKGTGQFTLGCIGISIYNDRDMGVLGPIVLQEREEFLIDNEDLCIAVIKNVGNVFLLEAVIDG